MVDKKRNLSQVSGPQWCSVNIKVGIVVSEWNDLITNQLLCGAKEYLTSHGVKADDIITYNVSGSFELALGAQFLLDNRTNNSASTIDAVICLGCIIQGETRHFEFISQAVAQGIMNVGLHFCKPVVFGVLTCDTMEQAVDRAGGKHGNKGVEAASTCLKMIVLQKNIIENSL